MRLSYLVLAFASASLLGGCSFSLAQDVAPPPDSQLSGEPVATVIPTRPDSPPSAARGELIYSEKCLPCHGSGGLGDGEQSGNLSVPVPPIGTAELARQNTPFEWFKIISEGDMENFMPPFAASLSAQQRWDVLAYVYGLSGELALDDRGNLIEVEPMETGSSEQPADESVTAMDVRGTVKNGSGGDLPADAEITLYAYDHGQDLFTRTTTLDEMGEFHFDQIALDARALYQVSVEYKGLIYFSEPLAMTDLQAGNEFELIVYDGTQETSALSISSLNLVFYFQTEGQVKVIQQVLVSNSGDLAVVPAQDGQALLRYEIPQEAVNVSFEEGQIGDRYEWVESGFADYRAVLPGEDSYQIIYAFDLNYVRSLEFTRSVEFPTRNVHIFVPQNEVELEGENLALVGEQQLDGVPYRVYQLNGELEAGEKISVRLSGTHPLERSFLDQIAGNEFIIGMVALGVVLGIGGFWLRRAFTAAANGTSDQILDEIVILDELFEKNKISEGIYRQKRERLKKRLSRALKKGGES